MASTGRPIRELRQTHTYAILDVAPSTFKDITRRLIEADVLQYYQDRDDKGKDLIVFGTTALRVDKKA